MATLTYEGQPVKQDFYMVRGDTWMQEFIWESPADSPVDLTSASARLQIRANTRTDTVLLSLASPDDITLTSEGKITAVAAADVTALLDFGNALYDLEITTAGGLVYTLVRGNITLIKDVTRD